MFSRVGAAAFLLSILMLLFDVSIAADSTDTSPVSGSDDVHREYLKSCSMANLLIATEGQKHRYAYGLTIDCVFFFFEISEYETMEMTLDYVST